MIVALTNVVLPRTTMESKGKERKKLFMTLIPLQFSAEKRLKCRKQPVTCLMLAMVYFPAVVPAGTTRHSQTDNPRVDCWQENKYWNGGEVGCATQKWTDGNKSG